MAKLISLLGALLLVLNLASQVPGEDASAKAWWLAEHGWNWVARKLDVDTVLREIETRALASGTKKPVSPLPASASPGGIKPSSGGVNYREGDPVKRRYGARGRRFLSL